LIVLKSEFSMNVLREAWPSIPVEKVSYLYSPADTKRFMPVSEAEKVELRRELLPRWMPKEPFILGWVGRNQWRKQVWLLFKVLHYLRTGQYLVCDECQKLKLFDWHPLRKVHLTARDLPLEQRPGVTYTKCVFCGSPRVQKAAPFKDIFLWNHMAEEPGEDWSLRRLEEQFDVLRGRDLFYTDGYELKSSLPPDSMPVLYQLWDCLLYLSGGEGFGLPAWEAMCSGIPSVYTHYSSHAEFLSRANAGLPVSGVLQPEAKECIWRMVADCSQAVAAVRALYLDRALLHKLGENGRNFVEIYRTDLQVSKWHHLFQNLLNRERS
jgi:glycosyltransferase involved in cell wall biosynthesis